MTKCNRNTAKTINNSEIFIKAIHFKCFNIDNKIIIDNFMGLFEEVYRGVSVFVWGFCLWTYMFGCCIFFFFRSWFTGQQNFSCIDISHCYHLLLMYWFQIWCSLFSYFLFLIYLFTFFSNLGISKYQIFIFVSFSMSSIIKSMWLNFH